VVTVSDLPQQIQLTPRLRQIVEVARELLEQDGADGLSMRRIAEKVGVRAPSLYEHIPNKRTLEAALISDGLNEWAELARKALHASTDPLAAIGTAYRRYATSNPHLYRLMTERPLPRAQLAPGVEERAARPVIEAAGGDADLARALWSFAHGMVINELNQRFPEDADTNAAWSRGLAAFRREAQEPSN
jgi:AcrR family transcriptional regulator